MSDINCGSGTWYVGHDGTFSVYAYGGVELVKLQLTPMQLVGLAADMNKVAWSLLDKEKRKDKL